MPIKNEHFFYPKQKIIWTFDAINMTMNIKAKYKISVLWVMGLKI